MVGRGSRLAARVCGARSPIHGTGCFARVPFAAGELIGTFAGIEVQEDGPHVLWTYDRDGQVLRGLRGTNLLRWLNHSPDPNAEFDAWDLYARRPIAAGEEITIDYAGT